MNKILLEDLTTKKPETTSTSKYGDVTGTMKKLLTKMVKNDKPQLFTDIVAAMNKELPLLHKSKQTYNRLFNLCDYKDKEAKTFKSKWFGDRFRLVSQSSTGAKVIVTIEDMTKLKG